MDENRLCLPCSNEINQYENQIVSTLIRWLMQVTCIEWVRGYSDTQALDSLDTQSQYGTVSITSITPSPHNALKTKARTDNEACVVIEHSLNIDVSLDVFNYSELCSDGCENKVITSADVLLRVNDARQVEELGRYLLDGGLTVLNNGPITNIYELEGDVHLRRSSMTLNICIDRKTSFVSDVFDGFCLTLGCDN